MESLEWIVLATDGAADTIQRLGLDDWDAIARTDQAGLSALLEHCREWEENVDPDGSQFPRAKRHDDKAVAAIRRAIKGDGTWLIKDIRAGATWQENQRNPMLALMYGTSVATCMSSARRSTSWLTTSVAESRDGGARCSGPPRAAPHM